VSVNAPDTLSGYQERMAALAQGEPPWSQRRRQEALEAFHSLPLPKRERTPLRARRLESIPAWDPGTIEAPPIALVGAGLAPSVVLTNGRVTAITLPPSWQAAGATVMPLRDALALPEVERYWGTVEAAEPDRFRALNRALWGDGLYVRVPRGAELAEPLTVLHWVGRSPSGVFPRVLFVGDPHARAALVDVLIGESTDSHRVLVSAVTEVVAEDGAALRYSAIQQLPAGAEAFVHRRGRTARDAEISWNTAEFGAQLAVSDHATRLEGAGSTARSVTVFFGSGTQHQDYTAGVEHVGAHTRSDILARGVMTDRARSVFTGMSAIRKGAVRSDARQKEQTLMLSDQARADAIPSLIIEDNDVYAAHAASAGPVDAQALYYLESRGIPEPAAVRLVVHGFLEPVIGQIDLPPVQEWVRAAVDQKLGWSR
jgi:Fe-S cluster assembly protein SufD